MYRKKLDSVIKTMPDDEILYIGAKTSFIFIGTKSEWERDKERLNKTHRERFERFLDDVKERFNEGVARFVKSCYEKKGDELFCLVDELSYCVKATRQCSDYLKKWTNIFNRPVIDTYPRAQKDGTVIIFEGEESGGYWFKEEYDAKECRNNPILKVQSRKGNNK